LAAMAGGPSCDRRVTIKAACGGVYQDDQTNSRYWCSLSERAPSKGVASRPEPAITKKQGDFEFNGCGDSISQRYWRVSKGSHSTGFAYFTSGFGHVGKRRPYAG